MAIKAFQSNVEILGHFDVLDTDMADLKGGEILVFDALDPSITDNSAPDVPISGTRSLLRLATQLDSGPFFLAGHDEEKQFSTPGFEVTSLFAQNQSFGQRFDSSGKASIYAQEGFYSINTDVLDTITINTATEVYTRLYVDSTGQLTATPSVSGSIVGFFIDWQSGSEMRNFPHRFEYLSSHKSGDSVIIYKTVGDGYLNLNLVSELIGQTGTLGIPTDGYFADGYFAFTTSTIVTDAINDLNEVAKGLNDNRTGVGAYKTVSTNTVDVTLDDSNIGFAFTNIGATGIINHNLPSAAAGKHYSFLVQDADGIRVTAASGDTIRVLGTVSSVAGNILATTIGNTIRLLALDTTEWFAESSIGTWTVS